VDIEGVILQDPWRGQNMRFTLEEFNAMLSRGVDNNIWHVTPGTSPPIQSSPPNARSMESRSAAFNLRRIFSKEGFKQGIPARVRATPNADSVVLHGNDKHSVPGQAGSEHRSIEIKVTVETTKTVEYAGVTNADVLNFLGPGLSQETVEFLQGGRVDVKE
jgi:hypothetical protein